MNLRAEPSGLARIHDALTSVGFTQDAPSPDGVAHRYRRATAVIDVLAPDNVGERAQLTLGLGRTIEAPGTTQAFGRAGVVTVDVDGVTTKVRRPNVVGALLGKAAAVAMISSQSAASRAKHLRDFDSLARLLGVADRQNADLTKSERRLLAGLGDEVGVTELGRRSLRALVEVPPR